MVQNFSSEVLHNYLVFISAKKYFQFFGGITKIYWWKPNGMP